MVTKSFRIFAIGTTLLSFQSFAQENLSNLSWGVKNDGKAQQIAIDHYTSGNILGVEGEDVRIPSEASQHRTVIVGVLDTGVDYTHPQLKDVILGKGYNAINPALDATDTHGHGTHISGIIGARLDSTGFRGVSQNVKILPVKVVQTGPNAPIRPQDTEPGAGTALTENVAKGLTWAIENGAEVINLSLAWPSSIRSKRVDAAMELARQKNVIIVSSAGNDSTTANVYPCIYENVICVGAHGPDGSFAHFSNFGAMVDVLAPGTAILSTWPLSKSPATFLGQVGYEFRNGTSMSSPFVAGALAELLSRGFSPEEAKSRLLLGARPTRDTNLFSSPVVGQYAKDLKKEPKASRFGNIDLTRAIALNPSPLILPVRKGFYEVEWDGEATEATLQISWKNRWLKSGETMIKIGDQEFSFSGIGAEETVITPVRIPLNDSTESVLHFHASVRTIGFEKDGIDIPIQVTRVIRPNQFPKGTSVAAIAGVNPMNYSGLRSVVNAAGSGRNDIYFIKMSGQGLELALLQDSRLAGTATFVKHDDTQLLNLYRLPDETYAIIFAKQDQGQARPDFYLYRLSADFKITSEVKLGTDTTVLSENFKWIPFKGSYTPFWISIGFTPKLDQPAYDPWNPRYQDRTMPRAFFLDGSDLRIIPLKENQFPLQIMPDGSLLISQGTTYFQNYLVLKLKDGKVIEQVPLELSQYRMMIKLEPGTAVLNLDGSASSTLAVSGASSPGSLRVSGIGVSQFDEILTRTTPLDSLVSVMGTFQGGSDQYFFTQSHYDLQFYTSGSDEVLSTSLNRYSYIPSMIFNRSFYPVLAKDHAGKGYPSIYIPASLSNGFVSEIVVADPAQKTLTKPASLRLKIKDPTCAGLGNLIAATETSPAKQVFVCGTNLIQVPITVEK